VLGLGAGTSAEVLRALEQQHLGAAIRGQYRRRETADAAADHDEVGLLLPGGAGHGRRR